MRISLKIRILKHIDIFNPSLGLLYVFWLCIVTIAYLYNCWVIPLRITFPYQTPENTPMWMILDYSMDLLYLLDVLFVKPRVMYLEDGFWVRNPKLTSKNYFQKFQFKVYSGGVFLLPSPLPSINRLIITFLLWQMDVLSLLPLDLLYFVYGEYHPIFRTPRLLKVCIFAYGEGINEFVAHKRINSRVRLKAFITRFWSIRYNFFLNPLTSSSST